ncbi:MAG: EAL domain-containing protein [Chloroflexi bacterium]|nr:EAL domain-containing protein [Chloroflexota bacterium]
MVLPRPQLTDSERLAIQHQGLAAIAELALNSASVDDVVRQALELLQRAVPYDCGGFYWWDVGRRSLRRAAAVTASGVSPAPREVRLPDHTLTRAISTRKPQLRDGDAGRQSEIGVPVLVKNNLIGAFGFWRGTGPFAEVELEYVSQFARQAAMPIENARLLRQLRQSEEQYRSLFEACLDVVYMTTPGGLFLDINPAGLTLFGFDSHEDLLIADIATDLYCDPADREEFKRLIAEQGYVRDREVRLKRRDGRVVIVQESASAMKDEAGGVVAYRGILRDVTEQKRAQDAIAYQAMHDGLSGLPNRALLQDRMQQVIRAATRDGSTAALLLMDLDRFKEVNDTLGHAAGDRLLIEVAARLILALRPADTVARLGGDEFAVVLPGADATDAVLAAQRIQYVVERPLRLTDYGIDVDVRTSIGIAVFPEHGREPDQLLQRADVAMYMAKHAGGGQALYSPEQDRHSPGQLALVGELRHALDQNGLALYYQPQVSLGTGQLVGVEGLVRWPHPQRGVIGPDRFIPLAEQTGLIRQLTAWVLETALEECRRWQRTGHQLSVAVNLSMRDLQDAHLDESILRLLDRYAVDPRRLRLEITESMLMADPKRVIDVLRRLRATGVEAALDDFGTGYSSLAYLADLPVNTLKIDRSFVGGLMDGRRRAAIVQATIELAHALDLRVVAEGIEDARTWDALAKLGCDSAQGYFIARPMCAFDLNTWLDARLDAAA